jgi:nickel transport protein
MYQKYFIKLSCLMLFFILSSGNALAHKVTVFAWVEGDTVLGESKFSGGKKAQNSEVIVWDLNGKELLRTRTNEKGEFSFPVPEKTAMRIELIAGMGHKAEWTIPLEDFGEADAATSTQVEEVNTPEPTANMVSEPADQTPTSIDPAQLESIIENAVTKALNKKITPLTKMMADLEQKGPSINEIFGGIGYIFGLMGVAMYFSSRRKK